MKDRDDYTSRSKRKGEMLTIYLSDDVRLLGTLEYESCMICLDPYDVRPLKDAEKYIWDLNMAMGGSVATWHFVLRVVRSKTAASVLF